MKTIVCINTGTTNTQVSIWRGRKLLSCVKRNVGVRSTAITGSNDTLMKGLRQTLVSALELAGVREGEVDFAMASGMISSEMGVVELPHVRVPISLSKLAENLHKKTIPEIISRPIYFVPGLKYDNEDGTCGDVIRGEEAETFGLMRQLSISEPCIVILPGSHCKFIVLQEDGVITSFETMLSGELLDALTNYTILSGATEHTFAESLEEEPLLDGAAAAQNYGITMACFQVRMLEKIRKYNRNELCNFLMGTVFYYDLLALEKLAESSNIKTIYIAGKRTVTQAYQVLIRKYLGSEYQVIVASPEQTNCLAAQGALMLAHASGMLE